MGVEHAKHWYVLHTYAGQEKKVERSLSILQKGELKDVLLEVRYPTEEIVEIKKGKKRKGTKGFFPGYILLQIALPDKNWSAIVSRIVRTEGVTGFLSTSRGARPSPLSPEEVRSFLALTGELKGDGVINYRHFFTEGEIVRIVDGPFKTFTGTIDEIQDEKSKMRVLVGIFGRSTPVEVSFTQVEKV